jgi:Fic family protein
MATVWYLSELSEARGKQALFTRQSPQKLKALREHALVESAISSNRIEGVEVDKSRVATLVFGKSSTHDRDEEEVRGYRNALKLVHESGSKLPVSEDTIKKLHKLSRGDIWDAGICKEMDVDIIETYADGRRRVRFRTVSAAATPSAMAEMVRSWEQGLRERWTHPLVLAAALNSISSASTPSATATAGSPGCCSS